MYMKKKDMTIVVIVLETGINQKSLKSHIVFGVVTCHYISRTKNKYTKAKFSDQSGASWLSNPQKAHLS